MPINNQNPQAAAGNASATRPVVLAGTYPVFIEVPCSSFQPEPRRDWAGSDPL